jgi:hypothetical protein
MTIIAASSANGSDEDLSRKGDFGLVPRFELNPQKHLLAIKSQEYHTCNRISHLQSNEYHTCNPMNITLAILRSGWSE